MKPKENKGYNTGTYDECQTPPYALEPLIPYLNINHLIWESASGEETLVKKLREYYYTVISTDILRGQDFFLERHYGATIVTNPPYSLKYEWLKRCYHLGHPFALLMPVEMLGTAKGQRLFKKHGIEIIFMSPRVDFLMPYALWAGHGAQFPVAWYTWKLNLPAEINYAGLNKPSRKELPNYWKNALGEGMYESQLRHSFEHFIKEALAC
jgi:hypothetical protein